MKAKRIAVMISGSGTNLQAIIDATQSGEINGEIALVISDKADAYGLIRAQEANIETLVVPLQQGESREQFDAKVQQALLQHECELVVLAGFMRIISDKFVEAYRGRMLNVHPSLLPKYTGLNTHQRAIDAGDQDHGCSVHFVTPVLDGGPVVLQAKVPVFEDDSIETLSQRVHAQEHRIFPLVVKWFCEDRLTMVGQDAVLDNQLLPSDGYAND